MIQVLFGDLPDPGGLDANGDGSLTVADILLLGPLFTGTVEQLLPHDVGDQLVYRVIDPLGKITTETATVTSSDAGGAFVIDYQEVDSRQKTLVHELQSYTDTGSQLLFHGFTDLLLRPLIPPTRTTCSPPLLRLVTPLIAGQSFSTTVRCEVRYADSGLFIGYLNRTDAFTPKEVVDSITVPAGTYTQVLRISGATELQSENQSGELETDEIYIAPGVGTVLRVATFGEETYTHELIGGTIGGLPVER